MSERPRQGEPKPFGENLETAEEGLRRRTQRALQRLHELASTESDALHRDRMGKADAAIKMLEEAADVAPERPVSQSDRATRGKMALNMLLGEEEGEEDLASERQVSKKARDPWNDDENEEERSRKVREDVREKERMRNEIVTRERGRLDAVIDVIAKGYMGKFPGKTMAQARSDARYFAERGIEMIEGCRLDNRPPLEELHDKITAEIERIKSDKEISYFYRLYEHK